MKDAEDGWLEDASLCESVLKAVEKLEEAYDLEGEIKVDSIRGGLTQWTTSDNKRFFPASKTCKKMLPGLYDIKTCDAGLYFELIPVITQNLLKFPQTNANLVCSEIQKFWEREKIFKKYNLPYKRGIIMWGPPGGGKSCAIQLIMQDIIERKGIAIKFTHPSLFTDGLRKFREIEPTTPIVVLMEDIDSIIQHFSESEVLNILDGVNQIDKAVFLATTNYPELLGKRITNRPSRFDKRFFIDYPNAESRELYIKHLIGEEEIKKLKINVPKWVADSEHFSLAHIKELFTAVVILGDSYENAVDTLRKMKDEKISSSDDDKECRGNFGFAAPKVAVRPSYKSGY